MTEFSNPYSVPGPRESYETGDFQADTPPGGDLQVQQQPNQEHDDLVPEEVAPPDRQIVHHRRVAPGVVGAVAFHGRRKVDSILGDPDGLPFTIDGDDSKAA